MNKEFINRKPMPEGSDNPTSPENGYNPRTQEIMARTDEELAPQKKTTEQLRADLTSRMRSSEDLGEQERLYFQILALNSPQPEVTQENQSPSSSEAAQKALHGAGILASILSENNVAPEAVSNLTAASIQPVQMSRTQSTEVLPQPALQIDNQEFVARQTEEVVDQISPHLNLTPELFHEIDQLSFDDLKQRLDQATVTGNAAEAERVSAMILLKNSGLSYGRNEDLPAIINHLNQGQENSGSHIRYRLVGQNEQGHPLIEIYNPVTNQPEAGPIAYTEGLNVWKPAEARNEGVTTIPPEVLTADDLRFWWEKTIEAYESRDEGMPPEAIASMRKALSEFKKIPGISEKVVNDMITMVEVRGALSVIEFNMVSTYNYKLCGEMITTYLNDDRLRFLWNYEYQQTPKSEPDHPGDAEIWRNLTSPIKIKDIVEIMDEPSGDLDGDKPQDPGAYWRAGGRGPKKDRILTYLKDRGLTKEAEQNKFIHIAENLTKSLGMAAFYTGPRNPETGGLVEREIMAKVRNNRSVPTISSQEVIDDADETKNAELVFMKNENFWDEWTKWRTSHHKFYDIDITDFPKNKVFMDGRDAFTRLMYKPEELERTNTGKARSLRHRAEVYVRALPVMNAYETTSGLLNFISEKDDKGYNRSMSNAWHRYGSAVSGADDLSKALDVFMDEPVSGGPRAWNQKEIGSNLKNVADAAGKMDFLKAGVTNNIRSYAVEKLLRDLFGYFQLDSYDRIREFGKVPKASGEIKNVIINNPLFTRLSDAYHTKRALKDLRASDWRYYLKIYSNDVASWLGDILKDFGKALGLRSK